MTDSQKWEQLIVNAVILAIMAFLVITVLRLAGVTL